MAGEIYNGAAPAFAGGWTTVDPPEYMTAPSAGLLAGANYGEHSPTLSIDLSLMSGSIDTVPSTVGSYPALLHGSYWPTIAQPSLPHHPGAWSQENIFPSGQEWESAMQALHISSSESHLKRREFET